VTMPAQTPGASRQDYETPLEFIECVEARFGRITWDAAASVDNSVVADDIDPLGERCFIEGMRDAFTEDWSRIFTRKDLVWLNPPFASIDCRWAPLVARWTTALPWLRLLFFTPASVGSEWFRKHVNHRATVLGLSPRMTFVGEKDPYPKDLLLSCFGFGVTGFDVWRWKEPKPRGKRRLIAV
jgi:hypothetical protein